MPTSQFVGWEERIREAQAKLAIAAEEESVASSEAASLVEQQQHRPAKRGRPKKQRAEAAGKKVSQIGALRWCCPRPVNLFGCKIYLKIRHLFP